MCFSDGSVVQVAGRRRLAAGAGRRGTATAAVRPVSEPTAATRSGSAGRRPAEGPAGSAADGGAAAETDPTVAASTRETGSASAATVVESITGRSDGSQACDFMDGVRHRCLFGVSHICVVHVSVAMRQCRKG